MALLLIVRDESRHCPSPLHLNPAVAAKLSVGQTIVLCGLPGCAAAAGFYPKGETAEQLKSLADKRRSSRSDTLDCRVQVHGHARINMHFSEPIRKEDVSILPGRRHFYVEFTAKTSAIY